MLTGKLTRRSLLANAAGGAAALGARARITRGAPGANERISIGIIGCGDRASAHMAELATLAEKHNCAITAVCDVWQVNLKKAVARVEKGFGREPRSFTRFHDLLALPDVDAVLIATTDNAHCSIMIAALKAGKDVYVEKPMSLDIGEANEALDLARRHERVVQVGTQRRSDGHFAAAAKEIASGSLGTISRVSCAQCVNHPRWARAFDDCKEKDVDWDAYLYNLPKRPFDPRLLRRWHLYKGFTNGLAGLWMPHYSDSNNMMLGTTYPTSAVAHGGAYVWKDGREHGDTFGTLVEYPEGFLMYWMMGLANATGTHWTIHGTQATLDAENWTVTPDVATGSGGKKAPPRKITPEPSVSHVANWLDCIRSRKRPNADIEYGHQHVVATVMAAAACETGRRQTYDPRSRTMRPG